MPINKASAADTAALASISNASRPTVARLIPAGGRPRDAISWRRSLPVNSAASVIDPSLCRRALAV